MQQIKARINIEILLFFQRLDNARANLSSHIFCSCGNGTVKRLKAKSLKPIQTDQAVLAIGDHRNWASLATSINIIKNDSSSFINLKSWPRAYVTPCKTVSRQWTPETFSFNFFTSWLSNAASRWLTEKKANWHSVALEAGGVGHVSQRVRGEIFVGAHFHLIAERKKSPYSDRYEHMRVARIQRWEKAWKISMLIFSQTKWQL